MLLNNGNSKQRDNCSKSPVIKEKNSEHDESNKENIDNLNSIKHENIIQQQNKINKKRVMSAIFNKDPIDIKIQNDMK